MTTKKTDEPTKTEEPKAKRPPTEMHIMRAIEGWLSKLDARARKRVVDYVVAKTNDLNSKEEEQGVDLFGSK